VSRLVPDIEREEELLKRAVSISPRQRREVMEAFFADHPGRGEGPHGLGRAILDFQAWQLSSGRVAGPGDSAWWRCVNGFMVLDVAAAMEHSGPASPAVQAWRDFAADSAAPQSALWEAHQRSLHRALRACAALLEAECSAEQEFAAIVIDVVDRTALADSPTDSPGLARLTERFYPREYPVAPAALPALRLLQESTADRLRGPDGAILQDVGITSTRWA